MTIWAAALVLALLGLVHWGPAQIYANVPKDTAVLTIEVLKIALMVSVAVLIDSLIRRFYWDGHLKRRLGRDTPTLIQDIVTITLVAVTLSIGLTVEAGLSVTGIVTASGATAIILGIALQAVIQDLFSGLAINLDGSYAIGDWLTIYSDQMPEPVYGSVEGITWRSTFLRLEDGRRMMVPNRMVTSNPVMNHSRPAAPKRLSVEIAIDNRIPTDRIVDMLLGEAFKATRHPGLARRPEPTVLLNRMDADANYFEVRFYINVHDVSPSVARSIVLKALIDAIQKAEIPSPVTQIELAQPPDLEFALGEEEERATLKYVPLFREILQNEHIEILVAQCTAASLAEGTALMHQGDAASSMFIIMEGAANVTIRNDAGITHEVAILAAGDVVGEMSLMTGAQRNATVTALTPMRVMEVKKEAVATLLEMSPGLAERFSAVLAQRQRDNDKLANRVTKSEDVQRDLLARMMTFFSRTFGAA